VADRTTVVHMGLATAVAVADINARCGHPYDPISILGAATRWQQKPCFKTVHLFMSDKYGKYMWQKYISYSAQTCRATILGFVLPIFIPIYMHCSPTS